MATPSQRALRLSILLGLFSALLWVDQSSASFTVQYCSSYNTASSSANYSDFQSHGLCDTFCDGSAYAILQDYACWCSDYTPATSTNVDIEDCDSGCPGYPDDSCGKTGEYYIYLFKNQAPSGTEGASSSTTSTTQSGESSTSTGASTSTSGTLSTMTTAGGVQTVTLEPDESNNDDSSEGGLSTGAAVGIAVGVVLAVIAIGGFVFFLWWKKRRAREGSSAGGSPRSSSAGIVSTMASMGESGSQQGTRRGSKFIPIDDRMEFHHGIYSRADVPSRVSVDSLRDDVDYSRRVLRTTNPDPVRD